MSWWHVICRRFLANMGDTQILWLNESQEGHVTSCHVSSTTLLGDVVCCLFLLHVVMRQKRMLMWRHIRHVGNMSQNVTCRWRCRRPSCYGDRQLFLQSPMWYNTFPIMSTTQHKHAIFILDAFLFCFMIEMWYLYFVAEIWGAEEILKFIGIQKSLLLYFLSTSKQWWRTILIFLLLQMLFPEFIHNLTVNAHVIILFNFLIWHFLE